MNEKLDVGGTLSEVFRIYREQMGLLLPLAFWLFLPVGVVEELAGEDLTLVTAIAVVAVVLGVLYEGVVLGLVRDLQDGRRDSSLGDLVRAVLPVLALLLAAILVYVVGVFAGFLLFVVPGLCLLTIWAVVLPAILIERRGLLEAFGRSRELVRGHGWSVFSLVLVSILIVVGGGVFLIAIAASLFDGPLVFIVLTALASAVTAPVSGLVTGVLYFRLLALHGEQPREERGTVSA